MLKRRENVLQQQAERISLPYISPISPLHLPYISPISPQAERIGLPYISPISPLYLPRRNTSGSPISAP